MPKSKVFFFLLLAFLVGVAVRSFIEIPVAVLWVGAWGSAISIIVGTTHAKKKPIVFELILLSLIAGMYRFAQAETRRPDLGGRYGKEIVFTGVVWDEPVRTASVQRLKVRVLSVEGGGVDPPFFTLATTGRFPRYLVGDEVAVRGTLERPENYDAFDYVSYLAKDEIFSTMFFPRMEKVAESMGSPLKLALSRIKYAFEVNIDRVLPEPHAAFLKGLTLGERESLPDELVESFNRTGVTHIIALSGYNITLVGRFFVDSLMFLTVPFYASFWIAVLGIVLFVTLTGASPSIVRAGIMGILILVAQREGRMYSIRNALALAGAAMVFYNPMILRFDAAFQLSFLATIGLVYLSPHVERLFPKLDLGVPKPSLGNIRQGKDILFPFKKTLVETLSAQLMVLPLLIYLFGRVSIVSPLTNVLVIMAVPYSMALGFLTGVLGFVWHPLSQTSGWVNWVLLEYKIRVIETFAAFPSASIELGQWFLVPLLVLYCFIGWKLWRK